LLLLWCVVPVAAYGRGALLVLCAVCALLGYALVCALDWGLGSLD
jgi:hypothetical protein